MKLNIKNISINLTTPNQRQLLGTEENTLDLSPIYQEAKRVQDVWRYQIYQNKLFSVKTHSKTGKFNDLLLNPIGINILKKHQHRNIVLIIESPHIQEYTEDFQPIAPAQGDTGKNIKSFLIDFLKKQSLLDQTQIYNFIICNPVQFQSSLFSLHHQPISQENPVVGELRNKAFRKLFNIEKENFLARLSLYNPEIIINACTSGLQKRIYNSVNKNYLTTHPNTKLLTTCHPSVWSNCYGKTKRFFGSNLEK